MFKESLKGRIVYLTNRYTNGIEAKKKDYRDTLVKPNIILNDKIKIINENFVFKLFGLFFPTEEKKYNLIIKYFM